MEIKNNYTSIFQKRIRFIILLAVVLTCNASCILSPSGSSVPRRSESAIGGSTGAPTSAGSCTLASGAGTENAAAQILAGYYGWNSSGTTLTGSLPSRGSWSVTGVGSAFPGVGYYSGVASLPAEATICSGNIILGVTGNATCGSAPPTISIAGDLTWGTTYHTTPKTLTFSIASAGSNYGRLSFSGTGTDGFIISEISGRSVNQLASVSDAIIALTSNGQTSTTVKIQPVYSGGVSKTMTLTLTDAAGSTQTVSGSVTNLGPPQTNLVLWLNSSTGVTYDGSDLVSSWADQSGNAYNATASGTSRPLYVANALGSVPALRFDGSNDFMTIASSFQMAQVFIVMRSVPATFSNYGSVISGSSADGRTFVFEPGQTYFHHNPYPVAVWKNGVSLTSPFNLGTINSFFALTVSTNNPSASRSYLLGALEGPFYYHNFEVIEILGFSSVLSAGDQADVEAYLMGRYSL